MQVYIIATLREANKLLDFRRSKPSQNMIHLRFPFTLLLLTFSVLWSSNVHAQDSLLVHYNFDYNVKDQSNSGNDGIAKGILYKTDRNGVDSSAAFFSGTASQITIPYGDLLLDNYTYSLWVSIDSLPKVGTSQVILGIGGPGGDQIVQVANKTGSIGSILGFYGGGYSKNGTIDRITNGQLPSAKTWYHLALTRSDSVIKFYVNCKLVSEIKTQSTAHYGNGSFYKATIGSRYDNSKSLIGKVDDLKIFNTVLSEDDIKILCSTTSVRTPEYNFGMDIYPIPSSGIVNLKSNSAHFDEVEIYNEMGQLVRQNHFQNGVKEATISLSDLGSGSYFIRVKKEGSQISNTKILLVK